VVLENPSWLPLQTRSALVHLRFQLSFVVESRQQKRGGVPAGVYWVGAWAKAASHPVQREETRQQMSITKERKQQVIGNFRRRDTDSGSPEVQIAVLTARINSLTDHLRTHPKDHAGRRGLLMQVSKRRRLLDYLKQVDPQRYLDMLQRLELRK
jgi:small subunit ribosomal protein S15